MAKFKILYIVRHDLETNDGVTKKINDTIRVWNSFGVDVKLVNVLDYSKNRFSELFFSNKSLIDLIKDFNPDVIYTRYQKWIKSFCKIQNYPFILEINTLILPEMKSVFFRKKNISSLFNVLYHHFSLLKYKESVSGTIFVSNEIKAHFESDFLGIVHPNLVSINSSYIEKEINNYNELFFIGSPGLDWHGVDRIKCLAQLLPDVIFNIVGIEDINYDNVIFHGYLNDYSHILKRCSACLGSMALDRKNMFEASSLKVREYIISGFPIILSHFDTSIMLMDESPSWVLNIDIINHKEASGKILKFMNEMSCYVIPKKERRFISYEFQESNRIDYLKSLSNVG